MTRVLRRYEVVIGPESLQACRVSIPIVEVALICQKSLRDHQDTSCIASRQVKAALLAVNSLLGRRTLQLRYNITIPRVSI